ncbi:MAG: CotH kinase family protein, partial [Lachnospiraceae bacterium]|nr:CotH kinase family protein [Lachnospiraceae bacterium]
MNRPTKENRLGLTMIILLCVLILFIVSVLYFNGRGNKTPDDGYAGELAFFPQGGFYDSDIKVTLKNTSSSRSGSIHYTLDGSDPDETSPVYRKPVKFTADDGDYPLGYCLKAAIIFEDGSASDIYTQNYICNTHVKDRFSTLVFFVTGDPDLLFNGPEGIFYGDNSYIKGRESERPINLQIFDNNGTELLSQYCGVRPYGGSYPTFSPSRSGYVRSMKFFARKEYDAKKTFSFDVFNETGENGKIDKYKKLVLRNAGNDYHFAFIRDEYLQHMGLICGYSDHEGVIPVVLYKNGNYGGLLWLHENYGDYFFKKKYGDDAKGEFVVLEGGELEKKDGDDEDLIKEYNETYDRLRELDLTVDENYRQVEEFIDVENYLDYFAFNLYANNFDWPHNNEKCYKYCPAEGEEPGEGVFDGRYRFLIHDMDWSLGWDEFSIASYDNFKRFFEPRSGMDTSLFAALMKRADARKYLREKLEELMNGGFSPENAISEFEKLDNERSAEQQYYEKWLEENEIVAEDDLGPDQDRYFVSVEALRTFLIERPHYITSFIEKYLG